MVEPVWFYSTLVEPGSVVLLSTLVVPEWYSLFLQEVLLLLAVRLDGVLGQELHEL